MARKRGKGMNFHMMKGLGMVLLGLLILANVYWYVLSWWAFVGAVFVLFGLIKLIMPHTEHW